MTTSPNALRLDVFDGQKNRIALAPAFAQYPPMLARVLPAADNGIEAFPVGVQAHCGWGDANTVIARLPDAAVQEWRDRAKGWKL